MERSAHHAGDVVEGGRAPVGTLLPQVLDALIEMLARGRESSAVQGHARLRVSLKSRAPCFAWYYGYAY